MSVKSGQAMTVLFSTANAMTGAAADAAGVPVGTLYINGVANDAVVTVTAVATGLYKAAVTLPALSAGDVASLRVAATVSGIAGEGVVWQETADTRRTSDLNDLAAAGAQAAAAAALAAYGAATEGDVTGLAIPTAGQIADAVWDETLAGHATTGSAGAGLAAAGAAGDPWATTLPGAYASNQAGALFAWMKAQLEATIITAAQLQAAAGSVTIHRGDTWTATMTGLGDLSGRTKLWFTVKAREWEADSEALVQIEETGGLLRLANHAPVGTGSLTVTNAATGSITLALSAAATALLMPGVGYIYDVQMLTGATVRTVGVGAVTVTADTTRAVS
jgi:hypothetical protein